MMANGRVDILSPLTGTSYLGSLQTQQPNHALGREAIKGVLAATPLSDLFFSPINVEALHQGVRYKVFVKTGTVVGRQSDSEMTVFMRAVFLREARNEPKDVVGQVRTLNASVLQQVVDNVVTNLTQWQHYRVDVSRLPVPLDKAISTNVAGTKIFELPHRGFF